MRAQAHVKRGSGMAAVFHRTWLRLPKIKQCNVASIVIYDKKDPKGRATSQAEFVLCAGYWIAGRIEKQFEISPADLIQARADPNIETASVKNE